jgi:ABC-type dipeptide/oligopeptide/nickel transport system permease subunit
VTTSDLLGSHGAEPTGEAELRKPATWRRLWHELLQSKKGLAGALVLAIVIFVAIAAPVISPYDPNDQQFELANASPTLSHPFGGDELGRDVFTRTLYGARVSFGLALLVVLISATIGTLLGAVAGYLGGAADTLIMRTTDFVLVFPWLLLALLLITILGPGLRGIVIALVAFFWLSYSRVVRAETLKLRELEFVQAARAIGSSKTRILLRHVLPNVLHTVIVLATLDLAVVMIAEAGLSYLGLGLQPPTATWGGMIAEGQSILALSPWIMLAPAAFLMLTVIGINLFGDWLRDVLDPSLRVQ